MAVLREKETREELIGVTMTWKDTNIGGGFLLKENGVVSISLSMNRRVINDGNVGEKITDVTWYLIRLLPAFKLGNMMVESFTYDEHV